MDYAHETNWVWDYQDRVADLPLGPTVVAVADIPETGVPLSTAVPPPPPPPPGVLIPPIFSLPPGGYPITDFDLSVAIANPNPAGSSSLIYSIDFGSWFAYGGGGLTIAPGSVLKAQALRSIPLSGSPVALPRAPIRPARPHCSHR